MLNLTPQGQKLVTELAGKYGISQDAVITVMQAVIRGNHRAAQFSHPDFGGHCQWMAGGMTMTPDMFNHALKARVDGLCTDLAAALNAPSVTESHSLYLPDATRATGHWWSFTLGSPAAAGSQNDVSYALFPEARRLAIESKGHVTVYDTGRHQISGLAQQQGEGTSLTFISQNGVISLDDLTIAGVGPEGVGEAGGTTPPPEGAVAAPQPPTASDDIIGTIERLAGLRDKGILTPEEFAAKKAELLSRL